MTHEVMGPNEKMARHGRTGYAGPPTSNDTAMSASETHEPLSDEAQQALSKVYHDLNNPLSIISGNAQFLLEISKESDVDDAFVTSIEDIHEAADRMAEALRQLMDLREEIE